MPDMPSQKFRRAASWDSGLRSAPANLVGEQRLFADHQRGKCGDLLRFHESRPAVSVGCHQRLDEHVRLDFCRARGIDIVRRASGGGTLYLDPGQLGVSLLVRRCSPWGKLTAASLLERFCQALADSLATFGIEARFSHPNDLEIDGRKCASAYLVSAQETVLLHASLLLEMDVESALCALRVPTEKLSADGLAGARERYAMLGPRLTNVAAREALKAAITSRIAASFGLEFEPAQSTVLEARFAGSDVDEVSVSNHGIGELFAGSQAIWRTAGGVLRATVSCDPQSGAIARAALDVDVQALPTVLFREVERAVEGRTICMIEGAVHRTFVTQAAESVGFSAEDVAHVLRLALDTDVFKKRHELSEVPLMFYDGEGEKPINLVLGQAGAMLVPYCAKPTWCKWRHEDGCSECGLCEVGEAYRLARKRAMKIVTVTSFEHLRASLQDLKAGGELAFVGMCCKSFFVKRHAAFQEAGVPALLMDISGSNCYELRQESLAYAGKFEANARLDGSLLQKVMNLVPRAEGARK